MKLTSAQEQAVAQIKAWHADPSGPQHFTLAGYAGTGKTTIAHAIVEALDERVHCCTPTGKAAAVLESKLPDGVPVSTIHSFLYQPVEVWPHDVERALDDALELENLAGVDPKFRPAAKAARRRFARLEKIVESGGCEFRERDDPNYAPLVIVDEASMVGDGLERDLRENAGRILFIGDPGQLPPVEGTEFFRRNRPDVVLEEVHRQAADSTILRLATAIRRGETFTDWDDVCRLVRGGADDELLATGDVVITGKNITRRDLNRRLRSFHGHSTLYPEKGELLMCLRNDHGRGLINGIPGHAASEATEDSFGDLRIDVAYGEKLIKRLPIDPYHFQVYRQPKLSRRDNPPRDSQFDFGYAITCHKSQGSEWDHVIVWDDKMRINDEDTRRRWTYTAVTRSSGRLTWINGGH